MNDPTVTLRSHTLLPSDFDDLSLAGDLLLGEDGSSPRSEAHVKARSQISHLLAMNAADLRQALRDVPHEHDEIGGMAAALCSSVAPRERTQAVLILELLVDCGDHGAMFNYARELIRGVNVHRDVARAEGLLLELEQLVDGNCKPVLLGMIIANLGFVQSARGDMKAALNNFERAAHQSEEAAFAAGLAYDKLVTEYGVERDVQKAAAFYQLAATRMYPPAMTNLGLLIATCQVGEHHAKGWELLRDASRLGDTVADETLEWLTSLKVN